MDSMFEVSTALSVSKCQDRCLRRTRIATGVASVLSGSASKSSAPNSASAVALSARLPGKSFLLRPLQVKHLSLRINLSAPVTHKALVDSKTLAAAPVLVTSPSCLPSILPHSQNTGQFHLVAQYMYSYGHLHTKL